jgi:hypothetical protein
VVLLLLVLLQFTLLMLLSSPLARFFGECVQLSFRFFRLPLLPEEIMR